MTERNSRACARRARVARGLPVAGLLLGLALAAFGARAQTGGQANTRPSMDAASARPVIDAASIVGAWQATLPTGLRVATLAVVPSGEGFGGVFVGYDYAGKVDPRKPSEGPPPEVSLRSGAVMTDARLEGDTFTFKVFIRHPSPPPGRPAGYEVSGEVKLQGGDTAELRLSAPHKPEPMVLKLTRE